MYSKRTLLLASLFFASNALASQTPEPANASALEATTYDTTIFDATPQKCVALRRGNVCYADITLTWQLPQQGDVCIRSLTSGHIMQCWQQSQQGAMALSFESTESLTYQLINKNTAELIGETHVQVTWVYSNKKKKRRWRLF